MSTLLVFPTLWDVCFWSQNVHFKTGHKNRCSVRTCELIQILLSCNLDRNILSSIFLWLLSQISIHNFSQVFPQSANWYTKIFTWECASLLSDMVAYICQMQNFKPSMLGLWALLIFSLDLTKMVRVKSFSNCQTLLYSLSFHPFSVLGRRKVHCGPPPVGHKWPWYRGSLLHRSGFPNFVQQCIHSLLFWLELTEAEEMTETQQTKQEIKTNLNLSIYQPFS